jgi:hypothetical protein
VAQGQPHIFSFLEILCVLVYLRLNFYKQKFKKLSIKNILWKQYFWLNFSWHFSVDTVRWCLTYELPERLSEIRSESFIFWSCFLIYKIISFWLVNGKEILFWIRKHDQKITLSDLISESLSGFKVIVKLELTSMCINNKNIEGTYILMVPYFTQWCYT